MGSGQTGWMEQRKHERVSAALKVTYRLLGEDEKEDLLAQPRYRQTTADQLPHLSRKFGMYQAVTKDISEGGLAILGDHPFAEGEHVEIAIQLPQYNVSVTFLAEVARCSPYYELGKTLYSAGVRILALNREDMDRLGKFLLTAKLGRPPEK